MIEALNSEAKFFLIAGVAVLGLALRTVPQPLTFRLSNFCILGASFLSGWLFTQNVWIGLALASSWLLLPWLALTTYVRRLRMPSERVPRYKSAPDEERFPGLDDLTHEIEAEKFTKVDDLGWNWGEEERFSRLFYEETERVQVTLSLVEKSQEAYYYIRIVSRSEDGRTWMTWNMPSFSSLMLPPNTRLNSVNSEISFIRLLDCHRRFLERNGVAAAQLEAMDPEQFTELTRRDLGEEIKHNLAAGILVRADAEHVRYSWRGLFFIWWQIVRELVRFG